MKKILLCSLVFGSLGFAQTAIAQTAESAKTNVVKESSNLVLMKKENGITVSYLETSSNSKESSPIYLKFFNENSEKVIFTWSLNDKDGKVISSSKDKSVVLEPGQSLGNTEMVAWLSDHQNPMDLSIKITLLSK